MSNDTRYHHKIQQLEDIRVALSLLIAGYKNHNDIPREVAEELSHAYRHVDIAEACYKADRQPTTRIG